MSRTTESIQNGLSDTLGKVRKDKPAPFWSTVQADIQRFRKEDDSVRALIRGLVSQGFQALIVYRIFRWFHERQIPTQPVRFLCRTFYRDNDRNFDSRRGDNRKRTTYSPFRRHYLAFGGDRRRALHDLPWRDVGRPRWVGRRTAGRQSGANRRGRQINRGDCHW